MGCREPYREDATRTFIDQMDVIKRFVKNYTSTFMYATTAEDVADAFKAGKVCNPSNQDTIKSVLIERCPNNY